MKSICKILALAAVLLPLPIAAAHVEAAEFHGGICGQAGEARFARVERTREVVRSGIGRAWRVVRYAVRR